MSRKSLLIDARMMYASGIGVYIRNLIGPLRQESNYIVDLLVPNSYNNEFGPDNIIKTSIPVYSVREIVCLPFHAIGYDLVWSPHYNVPLFTIRVKKRLVTIHDTYHLAYHDSLTFFQKIYAKLFFYQTARRSNEIITVSKFSKQEIIRYCKVHPEKISVIYNGIAGTFKADKGSLQLSYGFSLPELYILFIGNIKPNKNLGNLLKAYYELVTKTAFTHKLVVVGEMKKLITVDPTINGLINELQLEDKVVFTGYVKEEELPGIYAGASLLIFPSHYEGFGLPVLEAFASHTPVIASNIPAVEEVAEDAVLYFDPNDHLDLYEQIKHVLNDPALGDNLCEKGGKRLLHFSWQKSYSQHLKLIRSLLYN